MYVYVMTSDEADCFGFVHHNVVAGHDWIVTLGNINKGCNRLSTRTTTLIERGIAHSSVGQAHAVSCA